MNPLLISAATPCRRNPEADFNQLIKCRKFPCHLTVKIARHPANPVTLEWCTTVTLGCCLPMRVRPSHLTHLNAALWESRGCGPQIWVSWMRPSESLVNAALRSESLVNAALRESRECGPQIWESLECGPLRISWMRLSDLRVTWMRPTESLVNAALHLKSFIKSILFWIMSR